MRLLVRRPHAYWFLQEVFAAEGGIASAEPAGAVLGDGSSAPLPGIYVLDETGAVLERVALAGPGAREALLAALERHGGR